MFPPGIFSTKQWPDLNKTLGYNPTLKFLERVGFDVRF